ncbi:Sel1 domain-containing protein [Tepidicaulis marinus]|jgi:hypothetical protein|uniref:Sel1 domain-containing protein n=1 Tax=Tepidicaulis marinus TaxID=1333998 RepID=A0A081B7I7_9HYPH|nr:tetratricopeptide repeat protein [Tepidicaulis marinus]GAK44005.1 Sel1 domain-containing protein [Tepidicaulis marinus]
MRKLPLTLAAALLGLGGLPATAAADFERGIAAFRSGDVETAVEEWKASAADGHALSAYLLGNLYMNGRGVPASDALAFSYFTQAAEMGNSDAQVRLAQYYLTGIPDIELERDYLKALDWFDKAALKFNPEAQYYLGKMHRNGLGVPRSRVEGMRWLLLSAKKGYVPAFLELARIYAKGEGIAEEPVEGAMYLNLAKKLGTDEEREQANALQDQLKGIFSADVRLQGEARARQWLEARKSRG